MTLVRRLLAALLLACALSAAAQPRLLPLDEAASVPDFFSFRAQLQAALARRDTAAVLAVLAPDIKLSFGGDAGVAAFRTLWRPEAADSALWATLAAVLALGGGFDADGSFTAPYVYARWPQALDPLEHRAVVGAGVRVRAAAAADAPVVAALDFAIVELAAPDAADAPWVQVRLPQGRTGFVDVRWLRSPVDYRVRFAKRSGRWQMVFFLAGD